MAKSITMIPMMDERNNLSKWDLLNMVSKKNLMKRDMPEDEIKIMKEYTFQPNLRRQTRSPHFYNRSQSSVSSSI